VIKMKIRRRNWAVGMLMLLSAMPVFAGEGWTTVQPAYNLKRKAATVRVEGGRRLSLDLSLYGFVDVDATKEHPLDFESFYGEMRLDKNLGRGFALAAEYNGGTATKDTIRAGLTWTPQLAGKNFTIVKALPVDTAGKGAQVGLYSLQEFGNGLSGSLLAEYNFNPETIYAELRIKMELSNTLHLYGEARCSGKLAKMVCAPVVGLELKVQ